MPHGPILVKECNFAHHRDEIRRGQKKKLSQAAGSQAGLDTFQVECQVSTLKTQKKWGVQRVMLDSGAMTLEGGGLINSESSELDVTIFGGPIERPQDP